MKKGMLVTVMVLMVSAVAFGWVEDFSTDPVVRGWVDASPTNFGYGPGAYAAGNNVKAHLLEAYYVPLGKAFTQNDSFSAKFDYAYNGASTTNQEMFVGFFNKDDWFVVNDSPINALNLWVYNGWAPDTSVRVEATVATSSRTWRMDGGGSNWYPEVRNTAISHLLTYTAGAGLNGAGQVVIKGFNLGDYNGTPLYTSSVDLSVGDTFAVNSFGIYSGHRPYQGADGLWFWLMRAEVPSFIHGTVDLQDFSGDVTGVGVAVDLTNTADNTTATTRMLLGAGGGLTIPNVAAGTYNVGIKACAWLRAVVSSVAVSSGASEIGTVHLVNGDLDGSNSITSSDLSIVLANMDMEGQ